MTLLGPLTVDEINWPQVVKLISYSYGDYPTKRRQFRHVHMVWNPGETRMTRCTKFQTLANSFLNLKNKNKLADNLWKIREHFHFLLFLRRDWEASSKTHALGFIRVSKHSKTIEALGLNDDDETLALGFEIIFLKFLHSWYEGLLPIVFDDIFRYFSNTDG